MKKILFILILHCVLSIVNCLNAQFSGMGNSSSNSGGEQSQGPNVKQFQGDAFRGLSIHADIGSPIISLLGGYARSYEVQLDVNLYRRLYPIFEIGYATAKKEAMSGILYDTKAPFFRVGLNYGLLKPFRDDGSERSVKCYPFVGLRYACSPVTYNISNIEIKDEYWGTSIVEDLKNNLESENHDLFKGQLFINKQDGRKIIL